MRDDAIAGHEVRISVIIPTVDREQTVYDLLKHLERQSVAPWEIIVVDQTTVEDPQLKEYVTRSRGRVGCIRLAERGLSNARNVGIRQASGEVVLFLDDDIVPEDDLIRSHGERYRDADVAGVGGRVSGGYDRSGDPARVGAFRRLDGKATRNFDSLRACEVEHLPGGNMSFRREVFKRIGGFDTSFGGHATGEETDFCLRARRMGFRLVYEPKAAVRHLHLRQGGCHGFVFHRWLHWHAHNSMLFLARHAHVTALPLFVLVRTFRFLLFALEHRSLVLIAVGLNGLLQGVSTHRATRHRYSPP